MNTEITDDDKILEGLLPVPKIKDVTKLPSNFKSEYCVKLLKHMSEGKSYKSFSLTIPVLYSKMESWETEFEEWRVAKELGETYLQVYWETLLDMGIKREIQLNSRLLEVKLKAISPAKYHQKAGDFEEDSKGSPSFHIYTGVPSKDKNKDAIDVDIL